MSREERTFREQRRCNIERLANNRNLQESGMDLLAEASKYSYSYNFDWLSRPVIQHPQDIVAFQEIVWAVKPDLIIELGVARGGSLVLSASLLALIELCETGSVQVDPGVERGHRVVGIDVDIRTHNRVAITEHPLSPWITLIEGSSICETVVRQVKTLAEGADVVLVVLDSNHSEKHVLEELNLYGPLVSVGSYCIVFDTAIEYMPGELFNDRPWGPGDSPTTAINKYLSQGQSSQSLDDVESAPVFEIASEVSDKLLLTAAPGGFLRRVG